MDQETKDLLNKIAEDLAELKGIFSDSSLPVESKEKYVDIETICQQLKISKDTLRRYRKQNLIPFYKMKGKVYFIESEVKDALKTHLYGSFERK